MVHPNSRPEWWFRKKYRPAAPMSQSERDRLIAEHLAKHGVTRCPSPQIPEMPVQRLVAKIWF